MSSLPTGGKAQKSTGSRMARDQEGDSGGLQKVGAHGANVEERVEVAKRYRRAPSQ